ncbi:hypothetical protein, partial [Alcanivorax profundi]|uniref:hypothetical protein n=1 Tax=Alcanivorax profundi TaxID=2338368 RepID=UPI001F477D6E
QLVPFALRTLVSFSFLELGRSLLATEPFLIEPPFYGIGSQWKCGELTLLRLSKVNSKHIYFSKRMETD